MVILVAAFILMTLLIFCGSNNVIEEVYSNFHVAINNPAGATNLKKWPWKGGYVPVHGNKVPHTLVPLVSLIETQTLQIISSALLFQEYVPAVPPLRAGDQLQPCSGHGSGRRDRPDRVCDPHE